MRYKFVWIQTMYGNISPRLWHMANGDAEPNHETILCSYDISAEEAEHDLTYLAIRYPLILG